MSLKKCAECGGSVSTSANACPHCGARIKGRGVISSLARVFVIVFLIIPLGIGVFTAVYRSQTGTTTASNSASAPALGLTWRYDESTEQMGRGTVKHAQVNSLNEVNFDFPYSGNQRGVLTLRSHPKYGKDVILSIEKGQFLCGIDECIVAVRFDDGKAQNYAAVGPADHSTTTLFIRGHDRFVAAAKKAKRVSIEAQFYQEGTRVFEFDIGGLKW